MSEEMSREAMSDESYVQRLGLHPHPEGGFFREYYRTPSLSGTHSYSLCYFLLTAGTRSHFHRLEQGEWWLFHDGAALELFTLENDGNCIRRVLGRGQNEELSIFVEGNTWMAAESLGHETLFSCLVSPPFDFSRFGLASRRSLLVDFPQHQALIKRFTRV